MPTTPVRRDLSIIIPVYNEEACLAVCRERLESSLHAQEFINKQVEIIFVNDGSTDGSSKILDGFTSYSRGRFHYRSLHLSRNFGHSAAVVAGLEAATGEVIALIDADLQDPPELLAKMYAQLLTGHDVVYGVRESRAGETMAKRVTAWVFYRLINLLASVKIPKDAGDFRVMRREVVAAVLRCGDADPFVRGLVAWVGFRQCAFPYHRDPRFRGETKYPTVKMLRFAWKAISSFSNSPLLLIVYLGVGMTFVSLLIGAWAVRMYLLHSTVPGWTSLLLGFVSGNAVTLLMLGVVGLYIGKITDQVRGRPRYVVARTSEAE